MARGIVLFKNKMSLGEVLVKDCQGYMSVHGPVEERYANELESDPVIPKSSDKRKLYKLDIDKNTYLSADRAWS